MTRTIVNSYYPIEYFRLTGVDPIQYPDTLWWASRERFASVDGSGNYLATTDGGLPTTEYLDIDLGRIRTVGYLNLDILRAPINVSIEYDTVSDATRDSVWMPVQKTAQQPFDNQMYFDGNNRTVWFNADFFFTDVLGNPVNTRYIRLGFNRRDETWPLSTSVPFIWPVLVKHLRIGRAVATAQDTIGPLLIQDTSNTLPLALAQVDDHSTRQARQQFTYPDNALRGNVLPKIMGFGVLLNTQQPQNEVDTIPPIIDWQLFDVTDEAAPALIVQGQHTGVVTSGRAWLDIFFDKAIG